MYETREEADLAHANGQFIAGAEGFVPRWQAAAARFRDSLGARARLGLAYGGDDRQRLDMFLPDGQAKGLLVFVHGGYWLAFGREHWSHLAAGAVARGWACAIPSYRLAPAARIRDMTADVAASVVYAAGLDTGPVVVTGHSAGGHLSARMGCADQTIPRLARVVPISPLSDLRPLMDTSMQDSLRLDAEECATESPAKLALRAGVEAHVWVGGQERPSFLWQARLLSEAWDCPWTVDPGRHHFDVIDGLGDPASPLMSACLDGI